MAKAEFIYNAMKTDIVCNENDTMENIIQKFCQKVNKRKEDLCFLYSGQIINNFRTFNNLANSLDKQRKTISILVIDAYAKNESIESIYMNENKDLKNKLNRANIIIQNQQAEIQNLKNEITNIKNEYINQINDLLNINDQKDDQIKKLKEQLNNLINNNLPNKKITIYFTSNDQNIYDFPIPCLTNNFFFEVEEQLYKKYPDYRKRENLFLGHGRKILRHKTIHENNIENGETILMYEMDKF